MKIEDLDKILEQSLTNINIKSSSEVPDKEIDNLANSALSFLDSEEKNEKTKIQDYQKIKSVINDPLEKKTKENSIKQSQNKISTINQIKNTLNNDKLKLKSNTIKTQNDLENLKQQLKKNSDFLNKLKTQVQETFDKNYSLPIMKRTQLPNLDINLKEQNPTVLNQPSNKAKKTFKVQFEKSSGKPFDVLFSERGFKIGDTRLSFEIIEDALSKNFNITLDGGNGLVLDAVRMQKILKYKNRF